MDKTTTGGTKKPGNFSSVLPKPLRRYENRDFELQLRARFLYYLVFSILASIVFIIFYTSYLNFSSPLYIEDFFLRTLLPQIVLLSIVFICMAFLLKGHYVVASHMLLISVLSTIWFVMWMARADFLSRLDTIVLLMAALTILPLVIDKKKWIIALYIVLNIIILAVYFFVLRDQFQIPDSSIIEYFCDVVIAFIFISIVSSGIYNINKRTQAKALSDFKEKLKAERAQTESEKMYGEITEMLPQTIFETDLVGRLTFINQTGAALFGITQGDIGRGISIFLAIAKKDRKRAVENFRVSLENRELKGINYSALKKDGSLFPIEIYSKSFSRNQAVVGIRGVIIDVTERAVADKAIKESEERFQALMESMNEAIIVADNDHIVRYVNKRFTEKLGYTPDEIVGKVGYQILQDDAGFSRVEEANEERIGNKSTVYELAFKTKDGRKIDFMVSGAPYKNSEGVIIGSIGALTDITERKKADKELNESRQQFQTLAEMSPVGIFRTRADGYTTYVNPKWSEISGLSLEEAVGDGWHRAVHPDDRELVTRKWSNDAPLKSKSVAEYRFLRPDGSISWVLGNAVPEIIDGELKGYIGTITNITEVKMAQRELEESESRYRAIIEAFPDTLIISDPSTGKILFINEPGQRFTGIVPEDFEKPAIKANVHPDDLEYVAREALELLRSDRNHTGIIENRFIDAWGNTHWFSGIMSKIIMNGKTMLQTISRDITEKKAIEQEVERYRNSLEQLVHDRTLDLGEANKKLIVSNEELEQQSKELQTAYNDLKEAQSKLVQAEKMASLGVLAAGIAHEINNPLNFINGGAYALEGYISEHMKEHLGEVAPLIEGIQVGVQRAAEIVSSLNLYSRRDDLPGSECDMHAILDNCLVMLNNELKYRIEVTKDYTADNITVFGNGGRFHQVFLNVLTNAIHAIKDKGIINIFTKVRNKRCVVIISDNGCGISKDVIHKITDPFFTTKDPGKGTGLGLSITYNILKDYDGTIEFESEPGQGTKVIVTMPLMKE